MICDRYDDDGTVSYAHGEEDAVHVERPGATARLEFGRFNKDKAVPAPAKERNAFK